MALADDLSVVVEINESHFLTEMHRSCASLVQIVHVFRAISPEQMTPILSEFDELQLRWTNSLLPDIPALTTDSLWKAYLYLEDCGLELLPGRVFAVPVYFGSKIDTARAVAQLPGQTDIVDMTAGLSSLLSATYAEHDVIPTADIFLTFLL